jgi:acetylornithine deacetylase
MNPGTRQVKSMVDANSMQARSRVEKRLAELIAIDTRNPGGNEQPLAEKLARELTQLGAGSVEVFATAGHHSTFARFGGEAPALILNAHLDTVPVNAGYTSDPLVLVRREERLFGLGSADTKGAIAAILEALATRGGEGRPPKNLAILFSGDEELGGTCIRDFLSSQRSRGLKRAIVCEPSGCRVGTRHRGVHAARISTSSPGGHSSLAETVPNPLAALARAAVCLEELGKRNRSLGPEGLRGLCMNIAALDGGMAFNMIPTQATLTFSMRPGPGVDGDGLVAQARAGVTEVIAPLPMEWEAFAFNPAFQTRDLSAFSELFGERAQHPIDLPFGTEAGQFVAQGIDAVVFGPGRVEQAHKADEYVALDELEDAVRILLQVID